VGRVARRRTEGCRGRLRMLMLVLKRSLRSVVVSCSENLIVERFDFVVVGVSLCWCWLGMEMLHV
jgi:hypothetical protein